MRQFLLALTFTLLTLGLFAQTQRVVLFEEFSGENCGPCAAVNPPLNDFLDQYPSDVILLKYQTNIPSAGPLYNQNSSEVNSRKTYYSVNSAPWGEQDGQLWPHNNPNNPTSHHPAYWINSQTYVNNRLQVPSPFNLSVSHIISADADSFYATVTIVGASNISSGGNNSLKLRVAMIEDLSFLTPPGTNGEKEFHHVMRKMYPNAAGTTLMNTWTTSSNQSFTFSGKFPTYIYDKTQVRFVAFIQDDNSKEVHQAAISIAQTLQYDVKPIQILGTFYNCTPTFSPVVSLKNNGTSTLTSAILDVYVDNVFSTSYSWTGSLPMGNSQNVTIPALAGLSAGGHTIKVVATSPNGYPDLNNGNDTTTSGFAIGDAPASAPVIEGFEAGSPSGWAVENPDKGATWTVANAGSGSSKSYKMDFYNSPSTQEDYLYVARLNLVGYSQATLIFDRAHRQYSASFEDQLDIEVSTNCGTSWQTVYSKAGASLATTAIATASFTPTTAAQWKSDTVNLAPAANKPDVLIRFKGLSDYGNNLYVDNINIYQSGNQVSGVEDVAVQLASVYPNPASDQIKAEVALEKASDVTLEVYSTVGQRLIMIENQLPSGLNVISLNTSELPQGTYIMQLTINGGRAVKKFNIVR